MKSEKRRQGSGGNLSDGLQHAVGVRIPALLQIRVFKPPERMIAACLDGQPFACGIRAGDVPRIFVRSRSLLPHTERKKDVRRHVARMSGLGSYCRIEAGCSKA